MNNDPFHISFYTIIVKRSAVVRSYPGGPVEFDRALEPSRSNRELFGVVRMSPADVDWTLDKLFAAGLVPGVDLAVGEMHHGPLLTCPGVAFRSNGVEFVPEWTAEAIEAPEGAVGSWDGREAYTPGNALGYSWSSPAPRESQEAPEAEVHGSQATLQVTKAAEGSPPPTRVVFGSGPVHWLYHDDEPDDEYD